MGGSLQREYKAGAAEIGVVRSRRRNSQQRSIPMVEHSLFKPDQIRPHMEVIGAEGAHVGTVDKVEGDRIKLTKDDSGMGSHQGHHHYISIGIVAGVEGDK